MPGRCSTILHHQADVRRLEIESDQDPCLCLHNVRCLQQQVCCRWQADREILLAALFADGGTVAWDPHPIVVTPRPFRSYESFWYDQEEGIKVALFGESDHCRQAQTTGGYPSLP
jgi:hypothetical protein